MTDCKTLLKNHAHLYPNMQPCDAVKLLYQRAFGGGHLITDETSCFQRIVTEYQSRVANLSPLCEFLGNGNMRLSLAAVDTQVLPLECVFQLFIRSASRTVPLSMEQFQKSLKVLEQVCKEGAFSFSEQDLKNYLKEYASQGYPMVSHSPQYREAYHPCYRIIRQEYEPLFPLIGEIFQKMQSQSRVVIALEGKAASGKTTAADLLADLFHGAVVHMDDFFLPPALRTENRLQEPGGNVHYERFAQEVIPHLKESLPFSYQKFSCCKMDYDGEISIPDVPLVIVEGAYCLHPYFSFPYDLKIFFDVTSKTQKQRIIARNGEEMYQNFAQRWIPMEHQYFSHFSIPEQCEMVITTE